MTTYYENEVDNMIFETEPRVATMGTSTDSPTAPAVSVAPAFTGCNASDRIDLIVTALAKAQAKFEPIGKDKTAKIQSAKGNYAYSYADLATVLAVVRPVLAAEGVAIVQPVRIANGTVTVTTVLAHTSGQWMANDIAFRSGEGDPRSVASVITYARRYGLITMTGVAPEDEDDDAAAASPAPPSRPIAVPKAPDGFDAWLLDIEATAIEGTAALESAWKKSQPYFRKYLTDTDNAKWERLKTKAAQVKASA
jgi:hypothetical protein